MTGWTERERAREHEHQHMRVGGVTHASSHQAMRSACRTWAPSCACYRCISAPFKVLFGLHFGVTCESTWVLNPLFFPYPHRENTALCFRCRCQSYAYQQVMNWSSSKKPSCRQRSGPLRYRVSGVFEKKLEIIVKYQEGRHSPFFGSEHRKGKCSNGVFCTPPGCTFTCLS